MVHIHIGSSCQGVFLLWSAMKARRRVVGGFSMSTRRKRGRISLRRRSALLLSLLVVAPDETTILTSSASFLSTDALPRHHGPCFVVFRKAAAANKARDREEGAASSTVTEISVALASSSHDAGSPSTSASEGRTGSGAWLDRCRELMEFRQETGHCRVPKRFAANPALGRWVSKQRVQYQRWKAARTPCSLTQRRIDILNAMDFCWNATAARRTRKSNAMLDSQKEKDRRHRDDDDDDDDNEWWEKLQQLRHHVRSARCWSANRPIDCVPRQTTLGAWICRQRQVYSDQRQSGDEEVLAAEKVRGLSLLDPSWHLTKRQWRWEQRYQELVRYSKTHGDCCVPISWEENKSLAHWVSNQRKQYNLLAAGKPSDMTPERWKRLQAIGFVWNRWEYEFAKKQQRQHPPSLSR